MTSGPALRADCERCFALCCVAPAFLASADFAISKKAGQECPNLLPEFRCGIHGRLRPRGFPGCAVYDCFGAGQQVAQVTFGGQDWRAAPDLAAPMFAAFAVMRQLHELLWYLTQALDLTPARPVHAELRRALAQTERLTQSRPERLGQLDVAAHRGQVSILLRRASELARAGTRRWDAEFSGADLVGHDLRNADLNGASLRGAHLTGADLSGADLAAADVTGADLRGADLSGAALAETIFLTQAQLDAARGDPGTTIPGPLRRPSHWTGRTHGRRLAGREGSLAPARELRSYSLGMSGEAWLAKRGDDLGAADQLSLVEFFDELAGSHA